MNPIQQSSKTRVIRMTRSRRYFTALPVAVLLGSGAVQMGIAPSVGAIPIGSCDFSVEHFRNGGPASVAYTYLTGGCETATDAGDGLRSSYGVNTTNDYDASYWPVSRHYVSVAGQTQAFQSSY
jgi:hypothetical protein